MNRNHLLSVFNEVITLIYDAKEAQHVRFDSGKVYYLAKGALLYIENDVTAIFPDALITVENFKVLYNWITKQPADENMTFHTKKNDFIALCGDLALAVPRADDETNLYGDIEEVILRPLLVNKYELSLPQEKWSHLLGSLSAAHGVDAPYIPTVDVTVDQYNVVLGTDAGRNVRVKGAIKLPEDGAHHKEWKGSFYLIPLLLDPEHGKSVVLSFTDNETKQPSPLLIKYAFGVNLVAIPMWR